MHESAAEGKASKDLDAESADLPLPVLSRATSQSTLGTTMTRTTGLTGETGDTETDREIA